MLSKFCSVWVLADLFPGELKLLQL